ncbi:nanos homolog 2-like isoform X2 [Oratosquilla oratoria]|uniref:nanos homolog 2-like isoform X2 n=1 Tax=Oratosquilla oratoria TaxID=337810 RepID=UPI003F774B5E
MRSTANHYGLTLNCIDYLERIYSTQQEKYVLKIDKGKPENVPTTYRICNFCRSNGECSAFYSSHFLRDPVTKRLTCPILRKHVCPNCGASGDNGHTQSYCPKKRVQENCKHSLTLKLKKTERNSTSLRTKSK